MSQEPTPTRRNAAWLFFDGTILPVMGGAEDPPKPDPEPTPTPEPTPEPEPTPDPPAGDPPAEPKTYDEVYVKKLRTEAANRRTELREAQERLEKLEGEKLSETERTKQEAEKAQQRATALEARVKRAEVRSAAAGKEIGNPDLAADLIDPSKVELDEDGEITNADDLLDALLEKYPDLKAKPKEEKPAESLTQVLEGGDPPAEQGVVSQEQALHLAKTDKDRFNKLFDEGKIPASALGGQR